MNHIHLLRAQLADYFHNHWVYLSFMGGVLGISFIDIISFVVRTSVGLAAIGYTIWKWKREYNNSQREDRIHEEEDRERRLKKGNK